jgi:hemoglobin
MPKRLLTLVFVGVMSTAPALAEQPESLYKRLGGYDAIAAVVDNFVPRLVKDPMLGKYFVHSQDTLMHIRQLAVDQICAATGGPCIYIGRDMKTAHKGLGISAAEWDVAVKHLLATLDQFKVPAKEKDELVTIVGTLRADIVEK